MKTLMDYRTQSATGKYDSNILASGAKYQGSCLIIYRNKYRSFLRNQNDNADIEKAKSRAFLELGSHIESSVEDNVFLLFKLCGITSAGRFWFWSCCERIRTFDLRFVTRVNYCLVITSIAFTAIWRETRHYARYRPIIQYYRQSGLMIML